MQIHKLSDQNSLLNSFLFEIRDLEIQKDSMRFRRNIERIGEVMAYELSKTLDFGSKTAQTPLGECKIEMFTDKLVICSILRAGIPLHQGLLNYFDAAENAFVSAYRHHKENSDEFDIVIDYLACPSLEGKTLVLADPMLATGRSILAAFEALKSHGTPKRVILVSIIASKHGIEFISDSFGPKTELWVAAIDDELNSKGYIIPGLGDAGDLAFGPKLQS